MYSIQIDGTISLEVLTGAGEAYSWLLIDLASGDRDAVALALSMLQCGVTDCVVLRSATNQRSLRISLGNMASMSTDERGRYSLVAPLEDVEQCLVFLLIWIRDGLADVDHVDLTSTVNGHEAGITLRVPDTKGAISQATLREQLDDE